MRSVVLINKLIFQKIVEIVFLISFIFLSIPLWKNFNQKDLFATSYAKNELLFTGMDIKNPIDYVMFPMDDCYALANLVPAKIVINNGTLTREDYVLTLNIDKSSNLDYKNLKLSIDDRVYKLTDFTLKESDRNLYFILDNNSILGEEKEYNVRIWLDKDTNNDSRNKDLIFTFELFKDTINI